MKTSNDTSGSDAALAALQSSLASYAQEKQAKQATITNSVLPAPKNRFDAARQEKLDHKRTNVGSHAASPSLSAAATPRLGAAPTSVPTSEDEVKTQAMKTAVIHLLAMRPCKSEEIMKKTNIPKSDLDSILQKVGKLSEGKWQLSDRAYRELDVWKFGYTSQDDRQAAIDNAVKAYDRMRLGKEEKLWQLLLPKEERDKGKVLSRLHLGGGHISRGLTPSYQPSPLPHGEGASDSRVASAANTPRLGASTPRPGSSAGDVRKRLLSKDPKRARVAAEAKASKRKERESAAAASDRESGKPAKRQKKADPKVKSAEIVHSSEDESAEEGEVNDRKDDQQKAAQPVPKVASKPKSDSSASASPESSGTAKKSSKPDEKAVAKAKPSSAGIKTASPAIKASITTTAGKSTPQASNSLSAPTPQHKSQRSPQKSDSRPSVPSPLGAARPRVASDVSDRGAVGIKGVRQGTETPNGLGISNGVRKRQDTLTSTESVPPASERKPMERSSTDQQQKATMNGTSAPKAATTNGVGHKAESGVKRKAEDSPSQHAEGAPATKHRKTDSSSSQSQKSHASSSKTSSTTARTSPDGLLDGSSSDSAGSVLESLTYLQGVTLAEKFRDKFYPVYAKLYDEQAAMEARGEKVSKEERERLWAMHRRLEQMKREIVIASQRGE